MLESLLSPESGYSDEELKNWTRLALDALEDACCGDDFSRIDALIELRLTLPLLPPYDSEAPRRLHVNDALRSPIYTPPSYTSENRQAEWVIPTDIALAVVSKVVVVEVNSQGDYYFYLKLNDSLTA